MSYFQQRMELLDITPELNKVVIRESSLTSVKPEESTIEKEYPVFQESEKGIDIYVYTIEGNWIMHSIGGSRWKSHKFKITRLAEPVTDKQGNEKKYHIPKGVGAQPFFPPELVRKYKEKEKIKTLFLTEGYFKAFKGMMHAIDIVGLSSITHMRDKETRRLHDDILKLIKRCQVETVVWLTDGDCRNISTKALKDKKDLYTRPFQFFNSAVTFKDLLRDEDVDLFFSHINSENIPNSPKGLDDLLIAYKGKEKEVTDQLYDLAAPTKLFSPHNIKYSTSKLRAYFHLSTPEDFLQFHADKGFKELYEEPFLYHGTMYRWNEEESKCDVIIPGEAGRYMRVGDDYFAKIIVPDKRGDSKERIVRRLKTTIRDDHGKTIFDHIPKYQAFCNVPDHINYQQVINSCWNLYFPLPEANEPEEGEFPVTEKFLKHIFGTGRIPYKDLKTGEELVVPELDLGLDYVQLLYQKPTQILPILCLVSKENNTGKSTFGKWLSMIFDQNVITVGNADLSNDFNSHWASKLVVVCDEAKIDKQIVVEKVKSLSTADKVTMNAKGRDHVEIDFFAKFIFNSNHEETFIYASEDDQRYWVRKVPVIKAGDLDPEMLEKLKEEIPAFLHFLNQRKLATRRRHRAWFQPNLIRTEAFERIVEYSRPGKEKDLREELKERFFEVSVETLEMDMKSINREFFRGRMDPAYLKKILREKLEIDQYHVWNFRGREFDSPEDIKRAFPDLNFSDEEEKPKKVYKVKRFISYTIQSVAGEAGLIDEVKSIEKVGRPYVFHAPQILDEHEMLQLRETIDMRQRGYGKQLEPISDENLF